MADTKISALTAATTVNAADQFAIVQSGASKMATGTMARNHLINGSTATVSAAYAADTYLAGSSIVLATAGAWRVGAIYECSFDMVKTGAGTAAFTITFRMGTTGTVADGFTAALAFAVGTAVADTGMFTVRTVVRVAGATFTAALSATCVHHLAATGLITTGASGTGIILNTIGPGDASPMTTMGVSVNGGASFSGTNTQVTASLRGF